MKTADGWRKPHNSTMHEEYLTIDQEDLGVNPDSVLLLKVVERVQQLEEQWEELFCLREVSLWGEETLKISYDLSVPELGAMIKDLLGGKT